MTKMLSIRKARQYLIDEKVHFDVTKKAMQDLLDSGRLIPEIDLPFFKRISIKQLEKYVAELDIEKYKKYINCRKDV